jgi:leucyl/phenylalanyl-tRNA--protein transferase
MFHRATDASKVALVELVERLRVGGASLFDVQWTTPHLLSLGARNVTRDRYLALLADATARPQLDLAAC